jgi:hypothetical protein
MLRPSELARRGAVLRQLLELVRDRRLTPLAHLPSLFERSRGGSRDLRQHES